MIRGPPSARSVIEPKRRRRPVGCSLSTWPTPRPTICRRATRGSGRGVTAVSAQGPEPGGGHEHTGRGQRLRSAADGTTIESGLRSPAISTWYGRCISGCLRTTCICVSLAWIRPRPSGRPAGYAASPRRAMQRCSPSRGTGGRRVFQGRPDVAAESSCSGTAR